MKVSLSHLGGKKFEGTNGKSSFVIDPEVVTPLEYFALGLISCSGVDIAVLSEKQGFSLKNFTMDANIVRNESSPQKFNEVEVVYSFETHSDFETAHKWILASIETYCSTINTIRQSVKVYYTVEMNGVREIEKKAISSESELSSLRGEGGCCHAKRS